MQSLIYYNEPEGSKFDWRKLLHVNLFNATEGVNTLQRCWT